MMTIKKPQDTAYLVVERKHPDGRMSLFRCLGADPAKGREKLIADDSGRLAWVEMTDADVKPSLLYATSGKDPGPVPGWLQGKLGLPAERNPVQTAPQTAGPATPAPNRRAPPPDPQTESAHVQDLWDKALGRSDTRLPEAEAPTAAKPPPAKQCFIPDPGGAVAGSGAPAADPATQDAWSNYLGH